MASVKEQQLAALMTLVHDSGKVVRRKNEPDPAYFQRIREKATRIQQHERRLKRRNATAARKAKR